MDPQAELQRAIAAFDESTARLRESYERLQEEVRELRRKLDAKDRAAMMTPIELGFWTTVVLEAAACGLPVVGTAVGYIADWSPARAVAVPPQDAVALANAAEQLLIDGERRRHLAIKAREWVADHDADWTSDEFERLYARLITPGS